MSALLGKCLTLAKINLFRVDAKEVIILKKIVTILTENVVILCKCKVKNKIFSG